MAAFRSRRASVAGARRRRGLALETLEGRALLATATWISPTSGFWDVASNWEDNLVPQPGDDVNIRVTTGDVVVTYRGIGTNAIGDLNNQETLVIQSGSTFQFLGGNWTGGGTINIESGATLEISGGNPKGIGRQTINNQGTITWSGGQIGFTGGPALIVNDTGGVFDIRTDDDAFAVGGSLTFENRGQLLKTAGVGETRFVPESSNFTTTGRVEARTGVLGFDSPYSQLGFPSTTTNLAGGNLRFGAGATFGAGQLIGTGTIFGVVTNADANISPGGDQIGTITIVGNFAVVPASTVALPNLTMQIAGETPGTEIDQLLVQQTPEGEGGLVVLNGTLTVTTLDGESPVLGDRYPLIEAFSTSGKFLVTVLPTIPPNSFWLVDYAPDGTAIEVVATLADITLGMTTTPDTARVGEVLTYRLTVTNAGPNGAGNVTITDVLPEGLDFDAEDSTNSAVYDPVTRTVTINLGFFSVGATGSARIAVIPTSSFVGSTITNTAVVTSDEPDPDRTNNTATATVPLVGSSSLTVDVAGPASVGVGQFATYVVRVRNNGPSVATGVNISSLIPANTVFQPDLSTDGLTLNDTGTAVEIRIGSLAVGSTAQFQFVVLPTVATSGRTVGTVVTASSNETGDEPADDFVLTSVVAAPEVIGVRRIAGASGWLVIRFSQPMDPTAAANAANYQVRLPGRDGRINTGDDRILRARTAVYDAANNLVRVRIRGRFSPYPRNYLRVSARPGALMGIQGIPLAGNGSGFPGFDYVKRFAPGTLPFYRPRRA